MSKDLIFALNARAAFVQMRKRLDEEVEDGHVDYITEIPAVLAGTLPNDLAEGFSPELVDIAQSLLADEETLDTLFRNFQNIAGSGLLLNMMIRPGEE